MNGFSSMAAAVRVAVRNVVYTSHDGYSIGSLGMYSIQLAHLAGYKVVTVASPRNWGLCKSLGAEAVFDVSRTPLAKTSLLT